MLLAAHLSPKPRRLRPLTSLVNAYGCLCFKLCLSSLPQPKGLKSSHDECNEFLPWLEKKSGVEISSLVSIGRSSYGRSLFASNIIRTGDCILKVPFNVQLSPDNLLPDIKSLLVDVGDVAKLATVILMEQKLGLDSKWAPYINRLPQLGEIQSTVFWGEGELEMIRQSSVYQETVKKRADIMREFLVVKSALSSLKSVKVVKFEDFMHAYALVESRAWGSSKGYSLIPLADFLNHDGLAKAIVVSDEDEQLSEVIADRDYAPGEQIWISYGKFSNAILLLDFGFTLSYNVYDEVHIDLNIPCHDPLYKMKLDLLQRHCFPTRKELRGFRNSFTIKEVRSATGKGKGIPQSIRAAARVLCCTTPEELEYMVEEARENDGRLGRRHLHNTNKEIQAHQILLSLITELIEDYTSSIELVGPVTASPMSNNGDIRRRMAYDLLAGELRVLHSASSWLENYIITVCQAACNKSIADALL